MKVLLYVNCTMRPNADPSLAVDYQTVSEHCLNAHLFGLYCVFDITMSVFRTLASNIGGY